MLWVILTITAALLIGFVCMAAGYGDVGDFFLGALFGGLVAGVILAFVCTFAFTHSVTEGHGTVENLVLSVDSDGDTVYTFDANGQRVSISEYDVTLKPTTDGVNEWTKICEVTKDHATLWDQQTCKYVLKVDLN